MTKEQETNIVKRILELEKMLQYLRGARKKKRKMKPIKNKEDPYRFVFNFRKITPDRPKK